MAEVQQRRWAAAHSTPAPQPQQQPPPPAEGDSSAPAGGGGGGVRPRLVLLDFGLAEALTPPVRVRFISFLNHVVAGAHPRCDHRT